jgi:hypothetical protein
MVDEPANCGSSPAKDQKPLFAQFMDGPIAVMVLSLGNLKQHGHREVSVSAATSIVRLAACAMSPPLASRDLIG